MWGRGGEGRLLWDWIFFFCSLSIPANMRQCPIEFLSIPYFKAGERTETRETLLIPGEMYANTCTWFTEFNLTRTVSNLCCGYFESLFSLTFKQGAVLSVGKTGCVMGGALQPGICSVVIYNCDLCRLRAKRVWAWVHRPRTSAGRWQWGFSCQQPCWMAGTAAVSNQEEAIVSFWLLQTGLI